MTTSNTPARTWQVLLLGGASGTGKTSVSYRLARHFGVALTEVDDFQIILELMTTPEQQPAIHYWRTHPDPDSLTVEQIVAQSIAVGEAMRPALAAVIGNHLETATPLVLEGDFIVPALVSQPNFGPIANAGQVRAVFLYEPDEEQLLGNFLAREPEHGPQRKRAQVSARYGEWLRAEAERHGALAIPAHPWPDVLERILAALAAS